MANLVKLSVPVCQEKDYVFDLCKDGMFLLSRLGVGGSYFKSYTELTVVGPSHAVGCCSLLDSFCKCSQNSLLLSVLYSQAS